MIFLTGASIFIDGGPDTNKNRKSKETTSISDSSTVFADSKDKNLEVLENVCFIFALKFIF